MGIGNCQVPEMKLAQKHVFLTEVLYEFKRVGNAVKVSAIDPVTHVEICMVAPLSASQETMTRLAKQKLIYVINKRLRQREKK